MITTTSKLTLACLLPVAALVGAPPEARACSCLPPDLPFIYNNSSDVFVGRVLGRVESGHTRFFVFRIRATYKGCAERGQVVLLSSPIESAACGIDLRPGRSYLISAASEVSPGLFSIGLCGYNRPVRQLTEEDWQFLNTRFNCCGGECACVNDDPVLCLVDPCSVASCEEGECIANYCGGCRAEFYTEMGQAVCAP